MITCLSLGRLGRFANQLFQVAGVIGIATKSGQSYAFPRWQNTDHKERFGSNEDIEIYQHLAHELPTIPHGINFDYRWVDWGYHDVYLPAGNWDLAGHFQSYKYFDHCIDLVRQHLQFAIEYPQNNFIGVHYRAGDYEANPQAYHPRMPAKYYSEAVKHFPDDAKYLIFSDDPKEAVEKFQLSGRSFEIYEGDNYIDDFKMLKACKGFIISNSSYSAMAAILATHPEKKVVSPSGYNWFGDVAGINGNAIMHPDWTQITFSKTND